MLDIYAIMTQTQKLEGDGIMGSSSETKEQTVASEKYQPALNDYYNERFKRLIERMSHSLPINRSALVPSRFMRKIVCRLRRT